MKPKDTAKYFEYISIVSYIVTLYCFIHLHPLLLKLISYGKAATLPWIILEIINGIILSIAMLYLILTANYFFFRLLYATLKKALKTFSPK